MPPSSRPHSTAGISHTSPRSAPGAVDRRRGIVRPSTSVGGDPAWYLPISNWGGAAAPQGRHKRKCVVRRTRYRIAIPPVLERLRSLQDGGIGRRVPRAWLGPLAAPPRYVSVLCGKYRRERYLSRDFPFIARPC